MANFIFTWVKNYLGNRFYPYTHADAVYVDDTEEINLTTVLSDINEQLVSDLVVKDIFDNHLTDNAAHQDLFDSKLNSEEAGKFIKEISSDASTGIIIVTRQDNTTFTINIPRSLIFQSAVFNEQSNEIIITWSDHSESRIPVEGLVDIYSGSESDTIQIVVNDDNIISANVKAGSISHDLLSADIQNNLSISHNHDNSDILDSITAETISKIQSSCEHVTDMQKHIPSGGSIGQVVGVTKEGITWIEQKGNTDNVPTKVSELENDSKYISAVDGMGLSSNDFTNENKEKLSNIEQNANNYTHPETHPATMIVEDDMHQFVTAEEKSRIGTGDNTDLEVAFNHDTSILTINNREVDLSHLRKPTIIFNGDELTPGFNENMVWKQIVVEGMSANFTSIKYLNGTFIALTDSPYVFYGKSPDNLQKIYMPDKINNTNYPLNISQVYFIDNVYLLFFSSNDSEYHCGIISTVDFQEFDISIGKGIHKIYGIKKGNNKKYLIGCRSSNVNFISLLEFDFFSELNFSPTFYQSEWENSNNIVLLHQNNYHRDDTTWFIGNTFSFRGNNYFYVFNGKDFESIGSFSGISYAFILNEHIYFTSSTYNATSINLKEFIPSDKTMISKQYKIPWSETSPLNIYGIPKIMIYLNGKYLAINNNRGVFIDSLDSWENTTIDENWFLLTNNNIKEEAHNYEYICLLTSSNLIWSKIN